MIGKDCFGLRDLVRLKVAVAGVAIGQFAERPCHAAIEIANDSQQEGKRKGMQHCHTPCHSWLLFD